MNAKKLKLSILCFCLMGLGEIKAEEQYQLDDVVVSASGFEQDLVDAPASISVLLKKSLVKSLLRI